MECTEVETKVVSDLLTRPGRGLTLMAWVRFDDQYPIHRKVAGLSDTAFRLHSAAIFWCARNGTDGFVPEEDLDQVCAQVRAPARFASECVKRGTWHLAAHACTSENCPEPRDESGWVIHDYLEYQPTKDEAETARKKQQQEKSTGGKLGNHRRWHAARGIRDPDCPWCESSVSDRYPIGESDRSPIAPSRPDQSVVYVGNQSADRNARSDPEIDEILETIIQTIYATTSRVIDAAWAAKIRDHILNGHRAANPVAYVRAVIEKDPDPRTRFLEHQ
jgi:hypothetical protein